MHLRRYDLKNTFEKGKITFEGGNGDSIDNAVVVKGAQFDLAGTTAEFAWVTKMYGRKDRDWYLLSHSHGRYGDREIDTIVIDIKNSAQQTIFFDISESFGKCHI